MAVLGTNFTPSGFIFNQTEPWLSEYKSNGFTKPVEGSVKPLLLLRCMELSRFSVHKKAIFSIQSQIQQKHSPVPAMLQ